VHRQGEQGEAAFEVKRPPGDAGGNPLYTGLQGVGTGLPDPLANTDSPESLWGALQAQVALLESSLAQLRTELAAANRTVGIGHNQGPPFAPVPLEELDEIDNLIALLKEQGPQPPSDPAPLIAQNAKVTSMAERISQSSIDLGKEMAKGGAREIGKELVAWLAVGTLIKSVGAALLSFLGLQ
jgi:hypothetical protein